MSTPEATKRKVHRYKAFISYRHVDRDRRWAKWLIDGLETYRVPKELVASGYPTRIGTLFRDDEEIPASPDLSNQIEDALDDSEFLIVICSPDTPASQWVRREITYFQEQGRGDHILPLLVEGEPSDSFPPELRFAEREVTDADGNASKVREEIEPLAADVRARTDEPKKATEHRALIRIAAGLLRCRFDDLAQRDAQREAKRRRMVISAAATCLVAAISSGLYWWDQTRIKTSYYANFGTKWGVPFGVGRLDKETQKQRHSSFAIDTRGGRIVEMRHVNGLGFPRKLSPQSAHSISHPWLNGGERWLFEFADDGRLRKVSQINSKDPRRQLASGAQNFLVFRFEYLADKNAVVSFRTEGRTKTLAAGAFTISRENNRNSSSSITSHTNIAQHRLAFDNSGFIVSRQFETETGQPTSELSGSYGRKYFYDERGLVSAFGNLNRSGRLMAEHGGGMTVQFQYDTQGDLIKTIYLDKKGRPLRNQKWLPKIEFKRSPVGNVLEASYFSIDGRLGTNGEGYSREVKTYDRHGNMTRRRLFHADGNPAVHDKYGYSMQTWEHNFRGQVVRTSFYDDELQPIVLPSLGFAQSKKTYDERGNTIEESYLDTGGMLLRQKWGYAKVKFSYDALDRITEIIYFDVDNAPTQESRGFASLKWKYDAQGNRIRESYYDAEGNLTENARGVASQSWAYTPRGSVKETSFFNQANELVTPGKPNWARKVWRYDHRGNAKEVSFYGPAGQPVLSKNGCAKYERDFNDAGKVTRKICVGTDGQPKLGTNKAAYTEIDFDQKGNKIQVTYKDTREQLTLSVFGYARVVQKYDELSRLTERSYFDVNGNYIEHKKQGFARLIKKYDTFGNLVEEAFIGKNGKLIQPSGKNYARFIEKYNDQNQTIEEAYYSADGKLAINTEWEFARKLTIYDDQNRVIRESFFGDGGEPILYEGVFHHLERQYNQDGKLVALRSLNKFGKVVFVNRDESFLSQW